MTTEEPHDGPVMNYATSYDLRKRMYVAYNTRAYPANKEILTEQLNAL